MIQWLWCCLGMCHHLNAPPLAAQQWALSCVLERPENLPFFFLFFFFLSPPRVSGGSILFVNHICVGIAVPLSRENTKFRAQRSHECTPESRRYVELDVFPSFLRWPVHLKLDAQLIGFPEWGYHHCRGLGCSADSGTDTSHRDFIFCYAVDLIS